jgi:hypothetical protein
LFVVVGVGAAVITVAVVAAVITIHGTAEFAALARMSSLISNWISNGLTFT